MSRFALFLVLALSSVIDGRMMVDLTHTFDQDAPKYPVTPFGLEKLDYYKLTPVIKRYFGDMWLEANKMEFFEHQGTHIDAPVHFGNGRHSLEQIPLERLIGPGVVIDIRDKVKSNADYAVTVEDIKMHEAEYGRIPPNAIITFNSGWGRKYPNATQVFGTQDLSDPKTFHFPGWSLQACEFLLQKRQVSVVGSDTPSADPANPTGYPCHMYLQPNNVPLLEYVANLDRIPARGTTFVLGVMKVRGGSGGPTRIFALLDDDEEDLFSSAEDIKKSIWILFVSTILLLVS